MIANRYPTDFDVDSFRRTREQVSLAGVPIDVTDFEGAVGLIIDRALRDARGHYVVTPNAHHVTLYQNDALFRKIYQTAFLTLPDGVPLLWAARLLGRRLPCRVNGTDLFEALCSQASLYGLRVYLLGGREGAADAAAARLRERHPALNICGTHCPPLGFEHDAAGQATIVARINEARPHLLFVGLGAPKQEYWMYWNRHRLDVAVSLGIGVSFELVGKIVPRAPRWMQRAGLEWLFRLMAEPKRLWRRYLVGNAMFCALIARQYVTREENERAIVMP
jgi:N-acetylglucosaminyldiphosphoundecaprenol N-acetyl-beta-D-mannosaminyltransferase